MTRPRIVLPALLILGVAAPISATTLHVPGEYATIKAATTAAVAGDSIVVACGTYYESGLVLSAGVVLRSTTGFPDCVTVDGQLGSPGNVGILECSGDSTTRIEGLALSNGYDEETGGGMSISGSPEIIFCNITNCYALNGTGGVSIEVGSSPYFADCRFTGNGAPSAGSIYSWGSQPVFVRCQFIANRAEYAFAGAVFGSGTFIDCYFGQNAAKSDGGAIYGNFVTLTNCVFVANEAGEGFGTVRGGAVDAGTVVADNCTFYGNAAFQGSPDHPEGTAIRAGSGLISHSIIVGDPCGVGEPCGTVVDGGPGLIIKCTNIWYPTENAWAGGIAPQLGQNGNISVDPLFCDAAGGDFRLSSLSPCLDAACGNMGAFGLGCYDDKPGIISVNDVGNDQGRQVRLTWYRSNEDSIGGGVNGYAIYRRQDAYAASPETIPSSGRELAALPGWDYLTTIPSRWDNIYQAVVPTLCDSTITAGECWSAFFVSALTPSGFHDSPVDSGYSKDNLAPPTPTSFAVSYNTGSGNHLVWDAVAANDWAGFRVYRGSAPGFTPSPAALAHTTTQTTWDDPSNDGGDVHYRVTSFDAAGNESEPTSSTTVTVVGDTPQPLELELGPNVPNPFNPSTTIPFTIPSAGRVTIAIYDVSGARVRTLVNAEYQPGTHSAVWDGRNDAGATVGSGVYIARLAHAGAVQSRKMVVTK